MPHIHVIDDDADVRKGLRILLETAGYPVESHPSAEAFWQAIQHRFDELFGCLIVDIRMPGWSGLELQRRLFAENCAIPIIFLTGHGELPDAVEAMRKGAADFLLKPVDGGQLLQRIEQIWCLEIERCRQVGQQAGIRRNLKRLTGREREVIRLALEGKPNRDIAATLGLSLRTIEAHRSRLLLKLDATSMHDWQRHCEQSGLNPATLIELLRN